jgi:hypothetical protein
LVAGDPANPELERSAAAAGGLWQALARRRRPRLSWRFSHEQVAAVGDELSAGGEGGLFGGGEQHVGTDLFDGGQARNGCAVHAHVQLPRIGVVGERCVNDAGVEAVDADPVRGELQRPGPGEAAQRPSTGGLADSESRGGALVTGGTKGQGAAIVARLCEAGATVMTLARTKHQDDLDSDPFVPADVTTPDGAQTVLDQVSTRLGTLDILVQVVGGSLSPAGGFEALSDEHWKGELNRNLLAAVRLDRGCSGRRSRPAGAVLHISSIQRRMPLFEATLG